MKLLIALMILYLTGVQASAAITSCRYEAEPCDENGNHYVCYMYGWVGDRGPYCSADDHSSRRPKNVLSTIQNTPDWLKECTEQCMKETGYPAEVCSGYHCW